MKEYKTIKEWLIADYDAKPKSIQEKEFMISGLSMKKLAFILMELGTIHTEDLDHNRYSVVIKGGIAKKNYSIVALELTNSTLKIAAYADEGIINQHTSEGVIDEIERSIKEYIK